MYIFIEDLNHYFRSGKNLTLTQNVMERNNGINAFTISNQHKEKYKHIVAFNYVGTS